MGIAKLNAEIAEGLEASFERIRALNTTARIEYLRTRAQLVAVKRRELRTSTVELRMQDSAVIATFEGDYESVVAHVRKHYELPAEQMRRLCPPMAYGLKWAISEAAVGRKVAWSVNAVDFYVFDSASLVSVDTLLSRKFYVCSEVF